MFGPEPGSEVCQGTAMRKSMREEFDEMQKKLTELKSKVKKSRVGLERLVTRKKRARSRLK